MVKSEVYINNVWFYTLCPRPLRTLHVHKLACTACQYLVYFEPCMLSSTHDLPSQPPGVSRSHLIVEMSVGNFSVSY